MKTNSISPCTTMTKGGFNNLTGGIKTFLLLLCFLAIAGYGNAQTQAHCDSIHDAPSCNITGPLKACLNAGEMVDTLTIDFSSAGPGLDLTLAVNTSGSTIDSTHFISYSASDSEYIEVVYINPGVQAGSINLQLNVTVTYPDGCNMTCECSKSITIVNIGGSPSYTPFCAGSTTTMTVVGTGGSSYTYTLQPSGPTNTTGSFTGLGAGTYKVVIVGGKEGLFCNDTVSETLVANPNPDLTCSNTGPLNCTVKSVTLQANGCASTPGVTYSWSGPSFSSLLQCPTTATGGTYTVTATNSAQCTSTCTTVVMSNTTPPSLTCSNNGPLTCTTTSITLTANACTGSGVTYSWSGPGFTSASQCPSASAAGTYTVTATSTANGCTSTCSTNVGSNMTPPSLACSNTGPLTCTTHSVTLQANSCSSTPGTTYSWSGPSFSSSLQCPTASAAGTYTVTATSTANGCTSTCSTNVGSNTTPPTLSCGNTGPLTCTTTSVTLQANGCSSTPGTTYSWSGSSFSSSLQCPTTSASGTYTVTATSTANGCTNTCTTNVGNNMTPPSLTCGNNGPLTCATSSVGLTANSCTGTGITYSWSGPGYSSSAQCPTNATTAGTYTVTATSTANGCTMTCTTTITGSNTPPSLTCGGGGISCSHPSVNLTANSCTGTGVTYSWSGPGGYSSTSQCPATGVTVDGTYTVTATSTANGCTSTCTAVVSGNTTKPVVTLNAPSPLPTCASTGNSLCASSTGSNLSYAWTVSGTGWSITSSTTGSCVTYTTGTGTSGTFTVMVTDGINGCSAAGTVTFSCGEALWGCTLGFWKNHVSIWDNSSDAISSCLASAIASFGAGYSGDGTDNSSFAGTFGLTSAQMTAVGYSPTMTLLQALNLGGGQYSDFARQSVASLINGCALSGHFFYNSTQVITIVHNAIVSKNYNPINPSFDDLNQTQPDNCPSAGKATKRLANDGVAISENVTINAYPNPFSDITTIEILPNINYDAAVIELYDIRGQNVSTLYTGAVTANQTYRFQINASTLAGGVYIYSFKAGEDAIFGKVILIK